MALIGAFWKMQNFQASLRGRMAASKAWLQKLTCVSKWRVMTPHLSFALATVGTAFIPNIECHNSISLRVSLAGLSFRKVILRPQSAAAGKALLAILRPLEVSKHATFLFTFSNTNKRLEKSIICQLLSNLFLTSSDESFFTAKVSSSSTSQLPIWNLWRWIKTCCTNLLLWCIDWIEKRVTITRLVILSKVHKNEVAWCNCKDSATEYQ